MKKIFIFTTVAFLLVGNAEVFAQKGNFKKAVQFQNDAAKRVSTYGANDTKALGLFTKAMNEYQKCITVSDKNTGEAYHYFGRILYAGPKSLRNYEQALQYLYSAAEIYKQDNNIRFLSSCYNEIAVVHYRLEDFYSAFINFQSAAELDNRYAGGVACMYWLGLGVEQDLPKAMERYRLASLTGQDLWANIYALDYHIKEYEKGNYESRAIELFSDYLHGRTMDEDRDVR